MKKILAMVLAVMLVLSCLSGCGNNDQNTPSSTNPGSTSASSSASQSQYAYQAQYISLNTGEYDVRYLNGLAVSGEQVFLIANCVTGKEPMINEYTGEPYTDENGEEVMQDIYEPLFFTVNVGDNTLRRLDYEVNQPEEGWYGYSYASGLTAVADGTIWFFDQVSSYRYDLPEGFDFETQDAYQYYEDGARTVTCYHFDAQGALLETVQLQTEENQYLGSIQFTNDGIYATDYGVIYCYNAQGQMVQTVQPDEGMDSLVSLRDGIGVSMWSDGGYSVQPLDTETMTLGEAVQLPTNVYNVMPGFGEYEYLYMNNGTFYALTDDTPEKILSWIDVDVDYSNISSYQFMEDGTLYALENEYSDETTSYSLVILKQVDTSTMPQKQVLTLACLYLPWELRTEIIQFNKSHSDVRITVADYSQYSTESDTDGGLQKLNTEIMSGVVPDLFYISNGIPVDVYASKGILQDIWTLIDSDEDLSRDDLMTHFFDALCIDGKLYQVTDTFSISTVVGRSDVIGTATSWTLEEMMAAYDQLQEGASLFGEMDTRDSIFSTVISRNIGQFVDWTTGQCSFETQEFMDLLSLVKEFPEEFDYSNYDWSSYTSEGLRMRMRMQLLQQMYLYSFNDLQYYNAMCEGQANFIGYPTTDGSGSSFHIDGSLAISASCQNMDAAWQFVRQFLTEEYQTTDYMYQFPTNRHSFEAYAQERMTPQYGDPDEYGISIEDLAISQPAVTETTVETLSEGPEGESGDVELPTGSYYFSNEDYVNYYHMTQEEYDLFMELYERINTVGNSNEGINDIIKQECEAFFAGQKTVEETAAIIQNRASLYVAEQG